MTRASLLACIRLCRRAIAAHKAGYLAPGITERDAAKWPAQLHKFRIRLVAIRAV